MKKNFWQELPEHFTILAPMEGVTDVVFRQVIAKAGRPEVFYTEFTNVSSFASERGRHNALERLEVVEGESPIVAQIWGKNPAHFAELAAALEELGFDGLDINMGCPDRHVNKAGGGAAMIRTPELAVDCIRQAQQATNLPVSVKTRLGYTYVDEWKEWLTLLLQQNLAALTVHLRTRKEMSKCGAHYELIPEIVALRDEIAPQTKLVINGDIHDRAHAEKLWRDYAGVDGMMIGRGVFQNPFCFAHNTDTARGNNGGGDSNSDGYDERGQKVGTRAELLDLFEYHLDLYDERARELEERGSRYPYEPLKHFFKIYINSFDGASDLRTKLMDCKNTVELRQVLSELR